MTVQKKLWMWEVSIDGGKGEEALHTVLGGPDLWALAADAARIVAGRTDLMEITVRYRWRLPQAGRGGDK